VSLKWKNEGGGRRRAVAADGRQLYIEPRYGFYGNGIRGYRLLVHVGPGENDWDLVESKTRLSEVLAQAEERYGKCPS
jgi:hypothetical protein